MTKGIYDNPAEDSEGGVDVSREIAGLEMQYLARSKLIAS